MNEVQADPAVNAVEEELRRGFAEEGAVLQSLAPILRHLLGHDDRALFNDEVIARLRGMLRDLACQISQTLAGAAGDREVLGDEDHGPGPSIDKISEQLARVPGLLGYLHAIVLEWQASQALQTRLGVDPVVSPLLQALIGSPEADTAVTAMKLLAAQARFARYQSQMRMPLGELPGDLLHSVLQLLPGDYRHEHTAGNSKAEAAIRHSYDESATRLGLISRLVTGMGGGAVAALALPHAGVAIFATALALANGQGRETCLLALQDGQAIRLAVMLRATGIKLETAHSSLLAVHPTMGPASGDPAEMIAHLPAERAAALLAAADSPGDWADHGG